MMHLKGEAGPRIYRNPFYLKPLGRIHRLTSAPGSILSIPGINCLTIPILRAGATQLPDAH